MRRWGDGNIRLRGGIYWIDLRVNGRRIRESTGARTEHAALAHLERRVKELNGEISRTTTVNDLLDSLETDYALAGKLDPRRTTYRLAELRNHFGRMRVNDVTNDVVLSYIKRRQRDGRANGTINRDINVLRRAFTFGTENGVVERMPRFVRLPDHNPRKGFFTSEEVETLCNALPEYLRDFTRFAFHTGWRKSEITAIRWDDVDRKRGEIRLWTSKNGEGRVVVFNGVLRGIIDRRWEARDGVYVFHYNGRQVGDFKKSWKTATIHAELQHRTFHDLRRSAVRNLVNAGVSRQVAKRITGHKTDSVFDRYHIVSDDDLRDAMTKIDTV